ncbi:MAG: hypothetical protein JSS94_08430 [Bacteroidetes bacterium]|nr:hypothetical protein [Bacteroidota bacterium]
METITAPIIEKKLLESLKAKTLEEKQVIVHCLFPATPFWGNLIRIWPTTILEDPLLGHECTLIHAENISYFPHWTEVPPMKDFWFTLVFTGLPKDCKQFNLKEVIPEDGGFFVPNIQRNATDIYRVKI